jgi:hypothetical protein
MRMRVDVSPEQVALQLRDHARRAAEGGDVLSSGSKYLTNDYASWVSSTESLLRHYLLEPDLDSLYTPRFWQIRESSPDSLRIEELVRNECTWQSERLASIAQQLEDAFALLQGDPSATIVVLDTNVFLHCSPLSEIDWAFAADGPLRIVVPLRVVEELDDKKRDRDPTIKDAARRAVRWMRDELVPRQGQPAPMGDATTLEVYTPIGPRQQRLSADTEILEACETLETFTRRPLVLVTGDFALQLRGLHFRGAASGFTVKLIPSEYVLD